jgi:hypothetical protein
MFRSSHIPFLGLTYAAFLRLIWSQASPCALYVFMHVFASFILSRPRQNSATGYLSSGLINDWAKTQTLSLSTQLSAGARSLNLRPSLEPDGQLYSRHGPVLVPVPLSALLADIRRWAAAHPLELVQLHVSKCADNLNRAAATLHSSSSFSSSSAAAAAAVAAARARGGAACWDRARALFAAAGVLTPPRCVSPLSSVADVWSAATAAAGRQDAGAIVALEPHCVEVSSKNPSNSYNFYGAPEISP